MERLHGLTFFVWGHQIIIAVTKLNKKAERRAKDVEKTADYTGFRDNTY